MVMNFVQGVRLFAKRGWTADKLLKGAGAGSDPTEIDVPVAGVPVWAVSETLQQSADTVRYSDSGTYVKVKEIRLDEDVSALRIKFDIQTMRPEGLYSAFGRIYKNGVAFGTERNNTTTSYVTYSEDLANINANDLIQLYIRYSQAGSYGDGYYTNSRNFRLYGSKAFTELGGETLVTPIAISGVLSSTIIQN